jgi:hypothetical protein
LLPLANPFYQTQSVEAIASLGLSLIISILLGFPGFKQRDKILGHCGYNARLKAFVFHKPKPEEKAPATDIDNYKFYLFTKESYVDGITSFLALKQAVVSAIIIGSEIAFVINLFAVPILFSIQFQFAAFSLLLFGIDTSLLLAAWYFDKYTSFRKTYERQLSAVKELYEKWKERYKDEYIST